jgi:hypothetical protein
LGDPAFHEFQSVCRRLQCLGYPVLPFQVHQDRDFLLSSIFRDDLYLLGYVLH